jgi:hypothetical protein
MNERDFPVPIRPQSCGQRQRMRRWGGSFHQLTPKGKFMTIVYVGIDLAKNVFAVHAVDEGGSRSVRGQRMKPPRASFIRVRSIRAASMTGSSLSVRTWLEESTRCA